jgi:diguanylate cyclase (GGDEF)-like protein/PAS domain S-box-containing protein
MACPGDLELRGAPAREMLDGILASTADGVCVMDSGRRIRLWNRAAEVITGYAACEVLGAECSNGLLVHVDEAGKTLCGRGCPVEKALKAGQGEETTAFLRHRRGHRIPVRIRTRVLSRGCMDPMVLEVFSDMSGRPLVESRMEELRDQALHDRLTGLPNRRALEERLDSAAADRMRHGIGYGVILMDLDGMKAINDRWGHPVGDRALQVLADTVRSSARSTDTWGRWGGDEFLGLVRFADGDEIAGVGRRMAGLVCSSAVLLDAEEIHLRVSAGGAAARAEESPSETVSRADRMLYECKRHGGGGMVMA